MPPLRVDVDVRGDRPAAALLHRLSARLDDDGRPQLLSLLDELTEAQEERFRGQGVRWRKLAPSTLRLDRQQGRDPRPLVLTGELRESLTRIGHPRMLVQVRRGELRFGTTVYYARFHQKGEGVPKRAVVGLTRAWRTRILDAFRDSLLQHL